MYNKDDILLNKYRLEAQIGEGAFAQVYLATHKALNARRALKILRRDAPGMGSDEYADFQARFRLEAQLGAQLDHSNIIRVYDFEQDKETLVLVMEYAEGGNLAKRIQRGREKDLPISIDEVIKIGIDLAQGLSALHAMDVVHRDLKPSNILFDKKGHAKIGDLGLAQIPDDLSMRWQISHPEHHPGTPGYMSPEQESSGNVLRPPSDVFALGIVLFELLTSRNYTYLKPGTHARELRPDLPSWLDELLARMLAEEPTQRPWNGAEVAELLSQSAVGSEPRSPSHIIFPASACPACGWTRPASGALGEAVWPPFSLETELGGPGRRVFARPAAAQGIAVLPLSSGALVGIALADGRETWRTTLEQGLRTRAVIACGSRLLAALSDERQFTEAERGLLVSIAPATGKLTTLWEADTPLLSLPILKEDLLLLRTSKPELIALRLGTKVEVQWRAGLNSSGAMLPPAVCGGYVFVSDGEVMSGKSFIAAYELETGRPVATLPTNGMLSQPMAASQDVLVYQDGRKRLVALDVNNRVISWKKDYESIYAPPSVQEGILYVVVRGDAAKGEAGYYTLHAIHPRSGEVKWQAPLLARVLIPPTLAEGRLYLGSEEGNIFCLDAQGGALLWDQTLGSDENPLRTELLFADGLLFAGTYSGKVAAFHVAEPAAELEDPKAYLERGEFESAAAAYALKGDFRKAAKIYAEELQDYPKALALYEHGRLYREAGNLARSKNMLSEAERYFQLAGDQASQADVASERGDKLGAARLYEQDGKLKKAASLYEDAGEIGKAKSLYQTLGDIMSFLRLQQGTAASLEDVDFLEQKGKIPEAAEAAYKLSSLLRAADLFQRAENPVRELDVLQEFAQSEQQNERAWNRIAVLAKKLGRFQQEAQAWEHLGKPKLTADAYRRAAMQLEQVNPAGEEEIARLYQQAEHFFDEIGELTCLEECHQKVILYGHLPEVVVQGYPKDVFEEGEWNILDLTVSNVGKGVARHVFVTVGGEQFEADTTEGVWHRSTLGIGITVKDIEIHVRHLPEKASGVVPLLLEWRWQDDHEKPYSRKVSASVKVHRRVGPTPAEIHYHEKVYQADKLDIFSGDKVESGAQKGDKVEIHRGGGVKLTAGQDAVEIQPSRKSAELPCPTCHLSNEADAKVCIYCGNEMPAAQTSRRKKS